MMNTKIKNHVKACEALKLLIVPTSWKEIDMIIFCE